MRIFSSFSRFRAYRTVRDGSDVSRMRSFWVSCPPCSSTLYTSLADGGRCPILCRVGFSLVVTTKTIPHSGSPLPDWTSQLLSIVVLRGVSTPRRGEGRRSRTFDFRGAQRSGKNLLPLNLRMHHPQKPGNFCRNFRIDMRTCSILRVHFSEQEIPYETTTTRPRLLHGNPRPDHADLGRFFPCREGAREPSARTKRAGHPRSAHSVRSPRRDPHPAFSRFRVREIAAPPRRSRRHNVTGCRIALFLTGYWFCHGMADAEHEPVHAR